ncbi:MAG: hypothetical protein O2819_04570, partial [Planctomycetota bacterium]|nr:hypothetical protein [Planctomycetota bacterium]
MPGAGDTWNQEEIDAAIDLYFRMYDAQLAGASTNKAAAYQGFVLLFPVRSVKSIERKCQNISACLERMHFPWLQGLAPLRNIQTALYDPVSQRVAARGEALSALASAAPELQVPTEADPFVDPPAPLPGLDRLPPATARVCQRIDWIAREVSNRALGTAGERWVLDIERTALRQAGRLDLAERVRHVAEEDDGAGFDI